MVNIPPRRAGRRLAATLVLATAALLSTPLPGAAQAAAAPAVAASNAAAVALPEPRPEDSNAQRARSQPGNNAPFWRSVRDSGEREGLSSLPGAEKGVLIQKFTQYPGLRTTTAGEAWREVRNRWILPYGGSLLLIVAVALGLFYWRRGALGSEHGDGGLVIERFTPLERAAHWVNASAFVALAVSGIVMAFGKFFLLPVLGGTLFGWLTYLLKNLHNFVGPLFAVSLVIVLATFVKDNIATLSDLLWLKNAGGMLGDKEVPSHRFNPAEKGMFWWGMCMPGLLVIGSGLALDHLLPGLEVTRGTMQVAHMIHAVAALLMMTALIGHIYMGTVGVRGAYRAMRTGYTSEGWAREHHELWLDDIQAGKIPAQRSGTQPPLPAGGQHA